MQLTIKRSFGHLTAFIFSLTVLSTTESFAQKHSGGGSNPKFSIGATVEAGQGKMGNGVDVPDRAMIYTGASVFFGYNIFRKLRLGVNYDYYMAGQSVDPAEVNGQNISGKGSSPGIRIDYYDGKQSFGAIYRLSDTFTLDKATLQGSTAVYKSKSGFQIQYYRQIKKRFGFVIDYTTETFDDSLTNSVKWDRVGLGIVLTNFTSSK
ncbi:MAG: hypothetical protein H7328_07255 [Bdellovibrio sp.]|nr:hypothetical protein [Bdellovibrio sp.]